MVNNTGLIASAIASLSQVKTENFNVVHDLQGILRELKAMQVTLGAPAEDTVVYPEGY